MSIPLNGIIPKEPDFVKTGVIFRLFDPHCTWLLKPYGDGSPEYKILPHETYQRPPRVKNAADWVDIEKHVGIKVTNLNQLPKPWGKKGYMLRMKVTRVNPFDGSTFLFTAVYNESVNPAFPTISPPFLDGGSIGFSEGTIPINVNTVGIGDPFGASSSGICTASIIANFIAPTDSCSNGSVRCIATIGSFGKPYQYLAGQPVTFNDIQGAPAPGNSIVFSRFWTGVTFDWFNPFYGPGTGLIMNLTWSLQINGPPD